jgi:hypothetical protein
MAIFGNILTKLLIKRVLKLAHSQLNYAHPVTQTGPY